MERLFVMLTVLVVCGPGCKKNEATTESGGKTPPPALEVGNKATDETKKVDSKTAGPTGAGGTKTPSAKESGGKTAPVPTEVVTAGKQYTFLVREFIDFRRKDGAIYHNEGPSERVGTREDRLKWVKITDDPTVALLCEVEREFSDNEVKSIRKYRGRVIRVIGTADRTTLNDDGTIAVSILWNKRIELNFASSYAEKLENIKPGDLIVADGVFKESGTYEKCNIISFKTGRMEGKTYTGYQDLRNAFNLP